MKLVPDQITIRLRRKIARSLYQKFLRNFLPGWTAGRMTDSNEFYQQWEKVEAILAAANSQPDIMSLPEFTELSAVCMQAQSHIRCAIRFYLWWRSVRLLMIAVTIALATSTYKLFIDHSPAEAWTFIWITGWLTVLIVCLAAFSNQIIGQRLATKPPARMALFIIQLCMGAKAAEPFIGDIEEKYWGTYVKKYGQVGAQCVVWGEALRSCVPLLIGFIEKLLTLWRLVK